MPNLAKPFARVQFNPHASGGPWYWIGSQRVRDLDRGRTTPTPTERYYTIAAATAASVARREVRMILGSTAAIDRVPDGPDEDAIRAFAERRSETIGRILATLPPGAGMFEQYARAANYARVWIEPPAVNPKATRPTDPGSAAACVRRLSSVRWWRRAVRRLVVRRMEAAQIKAGLVHRFAAPCASAPAVEWRRATRDRHAQLLLSLEAINEAGERVALADAAASGQSNPANRRGELMVRIRGLETLAQARGMVGEFVTLTLPSRYHARLSRSGDVNPNWHGATPRDGHGRLCRVWAAIRRALSKVGLDVFGMRASEPHHDATPHWHLLVFVPADRVKLFRRIIRREALREDGREPGAWRRRVTFVAIKPGKGTAAGYVAKYVSKCVDGEHVGDALATDPDGLQVPAGDAAAYAERVTAWARLWGIRQFQFFGLPARVGVYRELRRLRDPVESQGELFEAARAAADAGDFAALAGALDAFPMAPARPDPVPAFSRLDAYGQRCAHPIRGLDVTGGGFVLTRLHTWAICRKSGEPVDKSQTYPQAGAVPSPLTEGACGPLGLVGITIPLWISQEVIHNQPPKAAAPVDKCGSDPDAPHLWGAKGSPIGRPTGNAARPQAPTVDPTGPPTQTRPPDRAPEDESRISNR